MTTKLGTILADFTTNLATSIVVGGTTATLQSATDDDGIALVSGRYFFTLDGENSNKEHFSCDLVGTSLTNLQSISRQGVESVGAVRPHRIGATVSLTDFAHILYINNLVSGITKLNASIPLEYDAAASITGSNMLATKAYVDGVAVSGAPNADTTTKGIVEIATQDEVLSKTATGGTGASLVVRPDLMSSTLLSDYKADTGTANTYAIAPSPAITAYTAGQIFSFKAGNANTTVSTLNVNALGVKTIKKLGSIGLASGDIAAGMIVVVEYDGTAFQMLNPVSFAPALQNGSTIYAADAGSTDDYAVTLVPAMAAYTTGMIVNFKANTVNTGACTLNVNSLGAKTIKKNFNVDLADSDIFAGQFVSVMYDGTNFQMISPVSTPEGYIGTQSLANGANTITSAYQSIWKKVIISAGADGAVGDIVLYKVGKTSGTAACFVASAPNFQVGASASVSGTTITISPVGNSVSASGTAYYYK